jgi:hypothetical protein
MRRGGRVVSILESSLEDLERSLLSDLVKGSCRIAGSTRDGQEL